MPLIPRLRRFLLPASILLNLFFLALVLGQVLRGALPPHAMSGNPLTQALARAEASLPRQDRAAFASVMLRDAPQYQAAARNLTEARMALEATIAATPFDKTATAAAMVRWRMAWTGFADAFSGPLVEALALVSPEGRRRLVAERRSERMGGGLR